MLKLNKSYKLINMLNRTPIKPVLYGLAVVIYLGAMLINFSHVLSLRSYKDVILGDLKVAFRRLYWYFSIKFPSANFIEDHFFDFTADMNNKELNSCEKYLSKMEFKKIEDDFTSFLFVKARRIHNFITYEMKSEYIVSAEKDFFDTVDKVLIKVQIDDVKPLPSQERKGDFSNQHAACALRDFSDALPLDAWKWFLISGTFLGLHREGTFLEHDYDIDIGIDGDSLDVDLLVSLIKKSNNFVVKKIDSHVELSIANKNYKIDSKPALLKIIHKSGMNIDIFIHYEDLVTKEYWHGSIIHRWNNTRFDLKESSLEGVRVLVPVQADRYLSENYGDWQTPVKDFDCTTGTPNLAITKNFLSIALFVKRLAFFSSRDGQLAKSLLRSLHASNLILINNMGVLSINRNYIVSRKNEY